MWHLGDQRYRENEQTPQVIDQSEVIDGDQFLSFAKTSRVVQRQSEPDHSPPLPTYSPQNSEDIWQRTFGYQLSDGESSDLTPNSAYQIQMLSSKLEAHVGAAIAEEPLSAQPGKRQRLLHSGKLPSPAELMGRKKRGRTASAWPRGQVLQPRVAAVLQHIGDLHRRQDSIDRLKRERWWGKAGLQSRAEEPGASHISRAEAPPGPTMSFSDDKTDVQATVSGVPEHSIWRPESLFGGFEEAPHLAPGGNPMMSFVMATADRQAKGAWQSPRLSHQEFWGIEHRAEEE